MGVVDVRRFLVPLVDEVCAGLRRAGKRAGGLRVKVKYADFHRVSRERLLAEPAYDAATLMAAIDFLLPRMDLSRPMRLVGLAATHLSDEGTPRQASLFSSEPSQKSEALGRALDAITAKHGKAALRRGTVGRDLGGIDRGVEHLERWDDDGVDPTK